MKTMLVLLAVLVLATCTADHVELTTCVSEKPDGFLMGLWHGMIALVTFIISLFSDSVEMYSVNNNGGWYNFGFLLGAGIIFDGSTKASRR